MTDLTTDAYLILEGRDWRGGAFRSVAVIGVRQNAPSLQPDQVAVKVRVIIDSDVFVPKPTPETTIHVAAPMYPAPVVEMQEVEP
jgi:hypothetical protein